MTVLLMSESETEEKVTPENVTDVVSPDHAQHLRLLEALVFAGTQALDEKELADRLPNDADVKRLIADLTEMYAGRGVNLVQVAGGYAFRTASDLSEKLKIERPVTRKLSRAAVETLGHHRLSPAGDPRRDRAGARRRPEQGHARSACSSRTGSARWAAAARRASP